MTSILRMLACFVVAFVTTQAMGKEGNRRAPASPKSKEVEEIRAKVDKLDSSVQSLEAELEILRAQGKVLAQRNYVNTSNRFYLKTGLAMIFPRGRTFTNPNVDSGLGFFVGAGQYIGKSSVIDLSLAWDVYPSLGMFYRYEFHNQFPNVSWGPVVGYKIRVLSLGPLEPIFNPAEELKSAYWVVGGTLQFPVTRSVISIELLYLFNSQMLFLANCGIHFLL